MRCLGEWRHSWDSFQYAVRYVLNRKAGKSAVVDVDQIETLNKINDFVILDMSTMNVIFSLKTFVSINCYNVLRPNNLTEEYFLDWISIWDSMHNVLNGWILEKNDHRRWKVDCLQQYIAKDIQGKQIHSNCWSLLFVYSTGGNWYLFSGMPYYTHRN